MFCDDWSPGMKCSYDVMLYDRQVTITGVVVKMDVQKDRLLVRYDTPQLLPSHRVMGGVQMPRRLERVSMAWIYADKAVHASDSAELRAAT